MRPGPALVALREATASRHAALESALPIADPDAGRVHYAEHVGAMWGWMASLEEGLWAGSWPAAMQAPARAVKARWLEADIAAARADGFLAGRLARSPAPALGGLAHRLGWAYAVEGSMLGGRALLARLEDRLSPWPARYLRGYGDEGALRWRIYLETLAAYARTPIEIDEACRGAVEAFDSLGAWVRR